MCLTELSDFDVDIAWQNVCQFLHCSQRIFAELKPQDHVAAANIYNMSRLLILVLLVRMLDGSNTELLRKCQTEQLPGK